MDTERGKTRQIFRGVDFPDFSPRWAPNEDSFAYSTGKAIYLVPVDHKVRKLANAAGYGLFGWSPDGRYVGLLKHGSMGGVIVVAVLDPTTGEVRTLVQGTRKGVVLVVAWWR